MGHLPENYVTSLSCHVADNTSMKTQQHGFTVMELMVTSAISAILVASAMPSFRANILNNRLTTYTHRLIADVQLGRSEALRRGVPIILCPSANPGAAVPACQNDGWTAGWILFASGDANSTFDAGTDTLIRAFRGGGTLTIATNAAADDNIRLSPKGSTDEGGAVLHFALCDERGASHGRQIDIPSMGRPRQAAAVSNCTDPS